MYRNTVVSSSIILGGRIGGFFQLDVAFLEILIKNLQPSTEFYLKRIDRTPIAPRSHPDRCKMRVGVKKLVPEQVFRNIGFRTIQKFRGTNDRRTMEDYEGLEERVVLDDHPNAVKRVIYRSQYWKTDGEAMEKKYPELFAEQKEEKPWFPLPDNNFEIVEENGVRYQRMGKIAASGVSSVEIPAVFSRPVDEEIKLYHKDGREKEDGEVLGIAYDVNGVPIPDWQIVDTSKDADGETLMDKYGRRRGGYRVEGAIKPDEYWGDPGRRYPEWGNTYGKELRMNVGEIGTYSVRDAQLCLTTEDFGWQLGKDADLIAGKGPPLLTLCYGEMFQATESIRLFTGLSEIHLSHTCDLTEVHRMLLNLGYIAYHPPTQTQERHWGDGIDQHPVKCTLDPKNEPGLRGPLTYWSWYYRMPPFLHGLWLPGEFGDGDNGPRALKYAEQRNKFFDDEKNYIINRLNAVRLRIADEQQQPWYHDYIGKYKTTEETPTVAPIDDDKE